MNLPTYSSMITTQGDLRDLIRDILTEKKAAAPTTSSGWQPWPPSVLNVPYYSPESRKSGVGPGEQRLAKMWGGKTFGLSVSYDVGAPDGSLWEVKAPGSRTASGELRIEQKGIKLIQSKLSSIVGAIHGLEMIFDPKYIDAHLLETVFSKEQFDFVREFLFLPEPSRKKDAAPGGNSCAANIIRGEITSSRIGFFKHVLDVIMLALHVDYSKIRKRQTKEPVKRHDQIINATNRFAGGPAIPPGYRYDPDVVMGVAKLVSLPTKELAKLMFEFGLSKVDMVSHQLSFFLPEQSHLAIVDPARFIDENWTNMLKASDVFSGLNGVVLVDEVGYRVVVHNDLDQVFVFKRVSKGSPYFGVQG